MPFRGAGRRSAPSGDSLRDLLAQPLVPLSVQPRRLVHVEPGGTRPSRCRLRPAPDRVGNLGCFLRVVVLGNPGAAPRRLLPSDSAARLRVARHRGIRGGGIRRPLLGRPHDGGPDPELRPGSRSGERLRTARSAPGAGRSAQATGGRGVPEGRRPALRRVARTAARRSRLARVSADELHRDARSILRGIPHGVLPGSR